MNKFTKLKSQYDVIIIGAGVSGIAAGHTLSNKGQNDFVILECNNEIGGRIRVREFENKMYATGAGWLHGKANNPLYELATKLGIAIEECALLGDDLYYAIDSESGNNVTESYLDKRNKLLDELAEIYKNAKLRNGEISPNQSIMDVVSKSDKFREMTNLDKTVISTCHEIFCGAQWEDLSAVAEAELEDEIYGDEFVNYRILDPYGISKIIDHLVEPIHNKIHLNSYVSKIHWQPHNVDKDGPVGAILEVKSGSENSEEGNSVHQVSCRRVIVTIQSHLLLESPGLFEPSVPKFKLDAWRTVPAVDYCRLVVRFPKIFWPAQSEWLVNVTSNPSNEMCQWQNLAAQHFQDADPNVLVCHLTKSLAQYSEHSGQGLPLSRLSQAELIDTIYRTMMKMFPKLKADPNGEDCRKPISALLISHWVNPNQLDCGYNVCKNQIQAMRWWGAFSCVGIGFDPSNTESHLTMGLGGQSNDVILFAGESTKPRMVGTLQGAFVSGKECAIKCLNN